MPIQQKDTYCESSTDRLLFLAGGMVKIMSCFLLGMLCGCGGKANFIFSIEEEKILDSIPSGSGLAIDKTHGFIISDDGTCIYRLNLENYVYYKIPLSGSNYGEYKEPKSTKHDFESAAFAEWKGSNYLVALGSGSGGVSRDSLLMLNLPDSTQKLISIGKFYKELRSRTGVDSMHWNIEGLTLAGNDIVMLNRGNNTMISFDMEEFFNYLLRPGFSFPKARVHRIQLPFIGKHEARLSGVCNFDKDLLLISASVEDTPDWISDGPVLGSYIVIYSLKEQKLEGSYLLKDREGKTLKEKIESVDVFERRKNGDVIFLAIADNDDGSSKLFRLKLQRAK